MAALPGPGAGGITSLVAFLEEHGEAVEADLAFRQIDLRHLGTPRLSWRRLRILIEALSLTPGTLLYRRLSGDDWTLEQHLLALIVDRLAVANWQRSKEGQKGTRRPKPISPLARQGGVKYGKTEHDPDRVKNMLSAYRYGTFEQPKGGE